LSNSLIIALFRSSNEKNFLFLSLPTIATVQSPTAPSTAALSFLSSIRDNKDKETVEMFQQFAKKMIEQAGTK